MDYGPFIGLPEKKYDIILVDPPWSYYGDQTKWGAAAKFYKTLSDEAIKSFPIKELLNDRSIVFLWVTCPKLDIGIEVIKSWGLYFRGVPFIWVKTDKNGNPMGSKGIRPSIVKPVDELVISGSTIKKGRPLPIKDEGICQNIFAPVRMHSQKPDEVNERIEKLYPSASKLELFARRNRPGWDCWGSEIN